MSNPYVSYTPEQDAAIERLWPDHTINHTARVLGRDPDSVGGRGRKLGLASKARVPITFTAEQRTEILSLHGRVTQKEIARRFGVSSYIIHCVLADERLTKSKTRMRLPRLRVYRDLGHLEMAPGNFAVDQRSYDLIMGRG